MQFRVLGPLTLHNGQRDVQIRSAKVRTILARLLVQAPHPITPAALIEEVWRDHPPVSATNTLQTYISQLRQLLEPERTAGQEPRVVRSIPAGYMLDVETQQVDSWQFEEALREGGAALDRDEPDKAAERLRDGLALWRGPAFDGVEGVTVEREAARLDQQRLLALDLRIQADLALGRHADLIGELEQLVGEYPLQEQFIAHLMLALYRCRRQADALTVYRDTYDRLLDEVGVSPGPALQALHERILRQDPALELTPPSTSGETTRSGVRHPPAPVPSTAPGTGSGPPRTRTRRRPLVTTAVAVAAVLGGGAAALHAVGAAPWQNPQPAPSKQPPAGSVFNEFDLAVHPGIGYDLDIPPGRPPDWHATNNPRSPDYAFLDFYRTGPRPTTLGGQISGVSLTNNDADFNAIHKLNPDQPATDCLGLPTRTVGNIHLDQLHAGDKVCLHTHENRWAFITVTRMPSEPAALLFVHVTVLNP